MDGPVMEIKKIDRDKKRFLDLLLIGDEQESMIDRYLDAGDMFALYDGGDLRSVCVVTKVDDDTCELKNIATYPRFHGQGYGSALIKYICEYYKSRFKSMLVGTGETPPILSFYERNGFRPSHRIASFFTDNYDHPIFEHGIQLVDMVYLRKELSPGGVGSR